ncbi:hypothetical protein Q3G72_032964 [Acer saccharum]|nr:hypothetical protein Q3G72_032964 [Acer saccharum]
MEIFPDTLKKQWSLWEIRSLVLLSLFLQIILIMFGSRRKINNPQSLIGVILNVIVWCAYISADWVATVALSVMARNEADCEPDSSKVRDSLQAFWAPFLLLHLGGPDNITAYSLEDNELWLRHLLGLIIEVGVAFYVFVRFWSSNALTFLAIPVFITGIVKYGERTWVLWCSSTKRFKNTLDVYPDSCDDLFGYQMPHFKFAVKEGINPEDHILVEAYYSYKRLKYLFANQTIDEVQYHNYDFITEKSAEDAFKLVAIELGLIYDVLYTKATIVYSRIGICLRCISFVCSVSAIVLFSIIIDIRSYPLTDITISYLLLAGAVLLEIYAFFIIFSSDRTKLWLLKFRFAQHNQMSKTLIDNFCRFMSCLHSRLSDKKRWSESMGQYNLRNSVLKERQRAFLRRDKLSWTSELLEKYQYLTCKNAIISLQETIFKYLKERADALHPNEIGFQQSRDEQLSKGGEYALRDYQFGDLLVGEEYDARLIIWHIVTEEYYKNDLYHGRHKANKNDQNRNISKWLSDYMLYLLLFCPSMMPKGIGKIKYERTCVDASNIMKSHTNSQSIFNIADYPSFLTNLESTTTYRTTSFEDPRSVLKKANCLALQLRYDGNAWNKRWEIISEVWLEMLAYAAQNCEWKEHAQHLRKGGELLTHVSVLMRIMGLWTIKRLCNQTMLRSDAAKVFLVSFRYIKKESLTNGKEIKAYK